MIESISFEDIATIDRIERRTIEQGYYDYHRVQKNFYKALNTLGSLDKRDLCCAITLRLKNKVDGVKTDWRTCNSVSHALSCKTSRKYWGKRSKYERIPMIRAIEPDKLWFKEHLHIVIRFKDLKQYYEEDEIRQFLDDTCKGFKEINERDQTSVFIRMFRYWNDTNELGNTIEYFCKTTSSKYNPLA
mgnify:CR=1 FL=1